MKLEVVVVPVSDVDRAKAFYGGLGWREDADFATDELRVARPRQLRLIRVVQRPGRQWLAAAVDQGTASRPLTTQEDSPMDVANLADLLHETAEHHDPYEKSAPEHNWWDWYAAYLNARLEGSSSEQAEKAAGVYMDGVLGAR
jgi:catechol 2,3-dioxygenase-like lactoylglutathione lyase family enzyme